MIAAPLFSSDYKQDCDLCQFYETEWLEHGENGLSFARLDVDIPALWYAIQQD